jgi:hypothetical protein
MKNNICSKMSKYVFGSVLLLVGMSIMPIIAQDKIDPISPIDGISYALNGKFVEVKVALRQLPATAEHGIPASNFKVAELRSATEAKTVRASSASNSKTVIYKIEISDTPSEQDIRLSTKWTEFSFFVPAVYRKTGETEDTIYESPKFTIVRNIQLPTLTIGTPVWQAETVAGNTVTKHISVLVTPSEPMMIDIKLMEGRNTVAQRTNFLVGADNSTKVALEMQPSRAITKEGNYTIVATNTKNTNVSSPKVEWSPTSFFDNYRLNDTSEKELLNFPSVQDKKVKVRVNTTTVGKSLKLIAEGINSEKIKLLTPVAGAPGSDWEFEVDLNGVTQTTVPFYFEGEGNQGQVFVGNNKSYFFNINNDSKVVGPLILSFNKDNQMIIKYQLNRPIPTHKLLLEADNVAFSGLPDPVLDPGKPSDYTITAKTEIAALLTSLAGNLRTNGNKEIPVTFKLVIPQPGGATNNIAEFRLYAYGVTSGESLKRIADISAFVENSKKWKVSAAAQQALLAKLGLAAMPENDDERTAIEEAVKLVTAQEPGQNRTRNFWNTVGSIALKVIPPLIGIPIAL